MHATQGSHNPGAHLDRDFAGASRFKPHPRAPLRLHGCLASAKIAPNPGQFAVNKSEFRDLCGFVHSDIIGLP